MRRTWRLTRVLHHTAVAALVSTSLAAAQAGTFHTNQNPLVLKAQGSFFVGGHIVTTDAASGTPGGFFGFSNTGKIAVGQMYVRYQIPEGSDRHVPVVLIHGGTLAGTCYETTPDGRMGWDEYFLRKGHTVYLPDQVSRARSGFDPTRFNEVRLGMRPASELPNMLLLTQETAWTLFRFGPKFGTPYPGEQFPVEAADNLSRQSIPDQNADFQTPPGTNPNPRRLADLANRVKGVVLVGHSESGLYPEQAALINRAGIKGLISLEPGGCNATTLTSQQLSVLAKLPTLVVFGDHIAESSFWVPALSDCRQFVKKVNNAGGDATLVSLPDAGLFGNSHMFMQDKNNLKVADLILRWIDEHVR
jgi:pimeloyl-ACP methyl ester carboxylesterase